MNLTWEPMGLTISEKKRAVPLRGLVDNFLHKNNIFWLHHLKEQVLKFKKNPTLGKKSEKLTKKSIFGNSGDPPLLS